MKPLQPPEKFPGKQEIMANSADSSTRTRLFDAFRGALIGSAEVVPGVSGGTVALIVGVYETLIGGAGYITTAVRFAITDLPRGRGMARASAELRKVEWAVVVPLLIGMATALVLGAKLVAPLVEDHQQYAYAVFFGLVLASLWIPFTHSGRRWSGADYGLAAAVAVGAFLLTGMPPTHAEVSPVTVFLGGSVAICALVLPGMSGSFILLTLGLYEPVIDAANERDLGLLGAFGLGCVVGLALFVKLLKWLLEHHHHLTLVVMTGLMAGSLRALWPWQDEDRNLFAPGDAMPLTFALMAVGFLVVVTVMVVEHRSRRRTEQEAVPAQRRHARV
jgi:putative membrane protein